MNYAHKTSNITTQTQVQRSASDHSPENPGSVWNKRTQIDPPRKGLGVGLQMVSNFSDWQACDKNTAPQSE